MANLVISYDLRKQRDYSSLIQAIKSYGTYAKVLESVWFVKSKSHTAKECREFLGQYIDEDDRIAVFDCSNNRFASLRAINKIADIWED